MKPRLGTLLIAMTCVLGLAACQKTKVDLGEDILSQMVDIQEETMEDFYDTVKDNSDICNKCLRDVRALVDSAEGRMRGLAGQWSQLKANTSIKDQRDAVNRVTPAMNEMYQKLEGMEEGAYKIFEEFQSNCPDQTPEVYGTMKRAAGLFQKIIGSEFM